MRYGEIKNGIKNTAFMSWFKPAEKNGFEGAVTMCICACAAGV